MNDNLLNHLLREGITPSFSFPLDVCDFKGEGYKSGNRHTWPNTQQDLKKALSEYSPGKVVTIDGEKYKVQGLSFFNSPCRVNRARHIFKDGFSDANTNLKWYNRCNMQNCGFVENNLNERSQLTSCPVCDTSGSVESGKWYRPEGFAPLVVPWDAQKDRAKPHTEPPGYRYDMRAQTVSRSDDDIQNSGGVKLPAPLSEVGEENLKLISLKDNDIVNNLPDADKELLSSFGSRMKIRTSNASNEMESIDLIIINSGFNSSGYTVCPDCGRLELEARKLVPGHHRPYSPPRIREMNKDDPDFENLKTEAESHCMGTRMSGNGLNSLFLGMTFKTDMILFTFNVDNPFNTDKRTILNNSLNDGVRAIKEALITEIQAVKKFMKMEIGGGLRKHNVTVDGETSTVFDIFLYDDVSGGAGLTTSLFDGEEGYRDFVEILKRVELRLSGSLCMGGKGCDKACVGCLLDFRNKREHDKLDRKNGLRILRYLLYGKVPTIETGNQNDTPHDELQTLANQLGGDLSQMNDYVVKANKDQGVIEITLNHENLKIRPISEMILPRMDEKVNEFLQVDFTPERMDMIQDFEDLWRSGGDPKELLEGKEMIHLSILKFYNERQKIASTINDLLSDLPF